MSINAAGDLGSRARAMMLMMNGPNSRWEVEGEGSREGGGRRGRERERQTDRQTEKKLTETKILKLKLKINKK